MQTLLAQAAIATEIVSLGYLAGSFMLYARRRLRQPAVWVPQTKPESKPRAQAMVRPERSLTIKTVEPTESKRKLTPVEQLRQQCQQAGIKWRDAHGKNKHLKKAEMIEALRQLEQKPAPPQPAPTPGNRKAA